MTMTEDNLMGQAEASFRYRHSPGLAGLIEALGASLLVTTYQAGKLIVLRAHRGRMSMLLRTFDKAMGLAVAPGRLALATHSQVWCLRDSPSVAARLNATEPSGPGARHDACYLPRSAHVTGVIDSHEVAMAGEETWVVNTHFSCLCTLDPESSFVPRWRPPFVSRLAREDRCHLNGLAMVDGRPRYVTAFGETDTPEGWRAGKVGGGVVIDVRTGRTVVRGLAMPHSPRVHGGRLWLLDSGNGRLLTADPETGATEVIAELPGYVRGLAFAGPYAFVGLSKARESAVFGGLPIEARAPERACGVAVVDVRLGRQVALLEFLGDIREVFDVQVLPGVRWPMVAGPQPHRMNHVSVIGPERPIDAP